MTVQTKLKPSKYQEAFYHTVLATPSNIVLKSTAGSGKTTSIVEACNYIPHGKKTLFAAFNKHIVIELKERLPISVDCSTLHSVGIKALYNHYNEVSVIKDKQIKFIEPIFKDEKTNKEKWSKIFETDGLLKLIRATMTPLQEKGIGELGEKHNLYPDAQIVNASIVAGRKLKEYNSDPERSNLMIDFQDMIEMCVNNKEIRVPQYDYILLDECQDMSRLDQLFIERMIKKPKGRLISVGDDRQSIYSFRGADINSFQYFINRPNTVQLPLTISYRCSKAVVQHAQEVYPEIEAWERAKEGMVRNGTIDEVEDGDMVLCRNVRPLVDVFFKLVEVDKKCTIVGKELEKGLLAVMKGIESNESIESLNNYLKNSLENLKSALLSAGKNNFKHHPKYVSLEEKVGVIRRIAERCSSVGEVEQTIETIFHSDDSIAPIRLMTIHKSKGLEARRVFLVNTYEGKQLIPSQYAVTKDQLTQEENLKFVARTRAKEELVNVSL